MTTCTQFGSQTSTTPYLIVGLAKRGSFSPGLKGKSRIFYRCTEVSYRELISTAVLIASAGMEHDRAAALFVFKGADLLMVHMRMQRALWTREM